MQDLTIGDGVWVDVDKKQPSLTGLTKVRVKILEGSMQKKVVEKTILAKRWCNEVRFMVGDWQRVTHWYDTNSELHDYD